MTALGTYDTDVSDMYAVHKALLGALDAAPEYVADAGPDSERVEVIGSFVDNVIEFLHVHHSGEDELVYPVLLQRCAESRSDLERVDDQHKLLHAPMDAGRSAVASGGRHRRPTTPRPSWTRLLRSPRRCGPISLRRRP
jgi:hypothetical protein